MPALAAPVVAPAAAGRTKQAAVAKAPARAKRQRSHAALLTAAPASPPATPPAAAAPSPLTTPDHASPLTPEEEAELALLESPEYATITERRLRVARYRAQKLTLREIASAIGVSAATVYRDIKALDAVWLKSAQGERDEHRARELAELQAMERQVATAYGSSQNEDAKIRWMAERLRIKARIASLLGLDAPRTFAGEIEVKDGGLSSQERRALAAYIAASQVSDRPEHADDNE